MSVGMGAFHWLVPNKYGFQRCNTTEIFFFLSVASCVDRLYMFALNNYIICPVPVAWAFTISVELTYKRPAQLAID
jgi:hypothetical protein